MKRLGWDPNGHNYNRFVQALDRLVAVTIRSKNAFYDAHNRVWERKKAFHILEEYDVTDSRHARPEDGSLFPSWIRWGPELYRNLQAGYIKSLDVDLFLSLKSVIAQALYRYLDAKRGGDGKPLYRIGIKKLAFEHLGLARTYYPSQIKRKLDPAHQELLERGFLGSVEYAPMKSGDEMVIYRFTGRKGAAEPASAVAPLPPLPPQAESEPLDDLAQRLIDGGVSRQAAIDLAKLAPEECGRQLEYLPYRSARDAGAVLVKSIREGWAPPTEWAAAQQKQQRQERSKRKQAEAEAKISTQEQAEAAFTAFWERLPESQRETMTERAVAQLRQENQVISEFGRKHPGSSVYQEALRPYLKVESGFNGSAE
jgi:hypothetical protein